MKDARVDAYIAGAPEFAGPLLTHFRELVHKTNPAVEETIKWRMPFFTVGGAMVCHMSAFKEHCGFGFWGAGMKGPLVEAGFREVEGAGSLGKIRGPKDMPKDKVLAGLLKTAFALAGEEGGKLKRAAKEVPAKERPAKARVETPEDLEAALNRLGALERFDAMSMSCRREYVEWIEGAKRADAGQAGG